LLEAGKRHNTPNEKWRISKAKNGISIKSADSGLALKSVATFENNAKVGLQEYIGN
jgi:hypothetical protein